MLTSKELYDKIDMLRKQRGYSVSKLNTLAGISHGTLNSWKQRGTMPKLEVLESLCFALEYPLASLLYDVDVDNLTGEETEMLSFWKQLNESQKKAVTTVIKTMIKN